MGAGVTFSLGNRFNAILNPQFFSGQRHPYRGPHGPRAGGHHSARDFHFSQNHMILLHLFRSRVMGRGTPVLRHAPACAGVAGRPHADLLGHLLPDVLLQGRVQLQQGKEQAPGSQCTSAIWLTGTLMLVSSPESPRIGASESRPGVGLLC